jgi:glyoxylase I family protein
MDLGRGVTQALNAAPITVALAKRLHTECRVAASPAWDPTGSAVLAGHESSASARNRHVSTWNRTSSPRRAPGGLWSRVVERVTGIGGFFFRARDPEALKVWYQERLGVKPVPGSYEEDPWRQDEGETAFAPFELDSEMIGPPEHTWMINFRVADLEAIVEQLRAAGEEVDVDPERYPNGRFAALRDPEGNGIQLWQPMGPP